MKMSGKIKYLAPAFAAALALFFPASFATAQVIRLEKSAIVEPGQDVRLGNIATIESADPRTNSALANTIILPAVQGPHKIAADSILMAIVAQLGAGGVSNSLQMSGADACEVTFTPPTPAVMPIVTEIVPEQPAAPESNSPSVITASVISSSIPAAIKPEIIKNQTLSDFITAELATDLNLPTDQFRVEFDNENILLDQALPAGSRWQVRPLTRTFLGTVPFSAELIQGTHVTKRATIQAHVEKKSKVLVAAKQIHGGDIITSDCYQIQELWLDQNLPHALRQRRHPPMMPMSSGSKPNATSPSAHNSTNETSNPLKWPNRAI